MPGLVRSLVLASLLPVVVTPGTRAGDWGEISQAERELASVPWHPEATAIILVHHTAIHVSDTEDPSQRDEHVRLKVLTEGGKKYGTVAIFSSEYNRLKNLDARVVLPDGREVSLPKNAVFRTEYSSYYDAQLTTVVMPEVSVGAIVEWRYTLYYDDALRTWEVPFENELATMRREVSFAKPDRFEFRIAFANPRDREPVSRITDTGRGTQVTYVLTDLPPLPDEPFRPPYADLAARIQFVPGAVAFHGRATEEVARSWQSLVELVQDNYYDGSRKKVRIAKQVARQMTADVAAPADRARLLYRFVRDEVDDVGWRSVVADDPLDKVLESRRGTAAEKALLLQVMLQAAGVPSLLGWTNPRHEGELSPRVANIGRVNALLVAAVVDEQTFFLDPSDADARFGSLRPALEGVQCLLVDEAPPRWVRTPESSAHASRRTASLRLDADGDGRLTGDGRLELTGHHAWRFLNWEPSPEATLAAWNEWLIARLPGFDVMGTAVEESVEERRITVSWEMQQRDEEVLGDEVTIPVARPLAVDSTPFALEVGQRQTTVMLAFRESSEVRLQVRWQEGWEVDVEPRLKSSSNGGGKLTGLVEYPEPRMLTLTRRFEVTEREFSPQGGYAELRQLFRVCAENDAETLVLARSR